MKVFGVERNSVVDGKGIRYVLFVQGCNHHCEGCHNRGSWDYDGGVERNLDDIVLEILSTKLLRGITFSGGEPFDKAKELGIIIAALHILRPQFDYWCYSGYTFEDLYADKVSRAFLEKLDVLVDGEYKQELRQEGLGFKGSANQRIIDVQASLRGMKDGTGVVLYNI